MHFKFYVRSGLGWSLSALFLMVGALLGCSDSARQPLPTLDLSGPEAPAVPARAAAVSPAATAGPTPLPAAGAEAPGGSAPAATGAPAEPPAAVASVAAEESAALPELSDGELADLADKYAEAVAEHVAGEPAAGAGYADAGVDSDAGGVEVPVSDDRSGYGPGIGAAPDVGRLPGSGAEAFRFRFGVELFLPPAGASDAQLEELAVGPEAARGRFFGFAAEGKQLSSQDFECRRKAFFSEFELPAGRLVSRSSEHPEGPGLWLDPTGGDNLLPADPAAGEVRELLQGCFARSQFWAGLDLSVDMDGPPPVLVVKNGVPALKYDLLVGEAEGRLAELLNSGGSELAWQGVKAELWRAEPGGWPVALRILLRAPAGLDLAGLFSEDPNAERWRPADFEGDPGTGLPEEYDLVLLVAGEVYDLNAPELLAEKALLSGGLELP